MSAKPSDIATILRERAQKLASAPTVPGTADGVAEVKKVEPSADPSLTDLRKDIPANAAPGNDIEGGQIGLEVTKPSETPHADSANPKDHAAVATTSGVEVVKTAGSRVAAVRDAILKQRPELKKEAAAPAPAAAPAVAAPVAGAEATKSASVEELDLSQECMIKLARAILSTEEGVAYATAALARQDGEQTAHRMIKEARAMADAASNEDELRLAAIDEVRTKAASVYTHLCGMISEDDADEILKTAALHEASLDEYDDVMLKQAYAEGMEDAAAMEEAGAAGGEPAVPMGGEQLSMEDIKALLEELVASGQISAEEVAAALAEIEGGGAGAEGAMPAEGAPPAPDAAAAEGGAPPAPAEAAPMV